MPKSPCCAGLHTRSPGMEVLGSPLHPKLPPQNLLWKAHLSGVAAKGPHTCFVNGGQHTARRLASGVKNFPGEYKDLRLDPQNMHTWPCEGPLYCSMWEVEMDRSLKLAGQLVQVISERQVHDRLCLKNKVKPSRRHPMLTSASKHA